MNLVIDVGNTRIKFGIFKDDELVYEQSIDLHNFSKQLLEIVHQYNISKAIISSVGRLKKDSFEFLNEKIEVHYITSQTPIPFLNSYKTPHTLGEDRIVLMAAAAIKFPNENVLVIDAGSCITYDFINDKKDYSGGSISPGIEMRYKALSYFTQKLPKLSNATEIPDLGNSTENSIHKGVLNGVIQEIEGVISQFKTENKKLTVILTGGDTNFLARNIKSTIFANPNFLLEGLNSILIFNKDI